MQVLKGVAKFTVLALVGCTGFSLSSAQPTAPPPPLPSLTVTPSVTPQLTSTQDLLISQDTTSLIPSPDPLPTETLPAFGYGPDNYPEDVDPLTGLRVADPSILNRRPMVIKITNYPRSVRPQWGLNTADHIYEYFIQDDMTRFIGVFYGRDASRVGPIRSARLFDARVVSLYNAIFAFGYADDRVMDVLLESDLRNHLVIQRPDNCPPMCRIGAKDDYNNLYTDTALLSQYVTDRGTSNDRQNLDGLRFEGNSLLALGGGEAKSVYVYYTYESYSRWDYDPDSQRYLRWQETNSWVEGENYAPLIDSSSGQQVAADNLVIMKVPLELFFQSHSTEIYDIALAGKGEAYALRGGRIFEINWELPSPNQLIHLKFPNGTPFPLKPGNVWFIVLGQTSYYERLSNPVWRFVFSMP
jgi:hypothetical protein